MIDLTTYALLRKQIATAASGISDVRVEGDELVFVLVDGHEVRMAIPATEIRDAVVRDDMLVLTLEDNKEVVVDATLTQSGQAADAKATGDAIGQLKSELSNKLPKSPVDWEQWTAEEQAAARERIGLDNPYELIEEITLEEDINEFIREYEPNGNAYSFRNAVICVIGTITSVVNICESFNKNQKMLSQLYRYGSIPSNSKVFYAVDFLYGRLGKSSMTITNNGNGSVIETKTDYTMFDSDLSDVMIAKIRLGYSIASGSKIVIYGVRA